MKTVTVRVLRFPSLGEPDEFDALAAEPGVELKWVSSASEIARGAARPDLLILPGSEETLRDLEWMRANRFDVAIREAALAGAMIFGVCGGFQIMGSRLNDPDRIEGGPNGPDGATGLGLFDVETTFTRDAIEEPSGGAGVGGLIPEGVRVEGYEKHGGRSTLLSDAGVKSLLDAETKGGTACPLVLATSDLSAIGTYLHGILADAEFRSRLLAELRRR